MLNEVDPDTVDGETLFDLSEDLRALAQEAEDNAGLSPQAIRRAVWHGIQRYVVAGGIFLVILVVNAKIFHENSIINQDHLVRFATEVLPQTYDAQYYGQLAHWGFAAIFSILLMLLSLMVATIIEGILRLVRFPWVDAVFFAILTLVCSGAGLWAYLLYAPQLKTMLYDFIK